jgi:hypothetical protein
MEEKTFEETVPVTRAIVSLLILNVVVKGLFLNFNYAEYTDGILQLTLFERSNALWPPLYRISPLELRADRAVIPSRAPIVQFARRNVWLPALYVLSDCVPLECARDDRFAVWVLIPSVLLFPLSGSFANSP